MKRKFREPSETTRAKLRAKKSGSLNPMFGKKHKEETKRLISQALKRYWDTVPSKNNNINNNEL